MKTYTIYQVKEYQVPKSYEKKEGDLLVKEYETKYDLIIKYQTDNRENASQWMDTTKNNLARYTSKYNENKNDYDLKISKKGYCCFVDLIED